VTDVKPLFANAGSPGFASRPARPFAEAVTRVDVPVQLSPWSPKSEAAPIATPMIDVEAIRADAVAKGRDEGLAETAALRAKLRMLVEKAEAQATTRRDRVGELASDAACAVVEAWSQADRRAVLTSVVRAWTEQALGVATARVNPADVALVPDMPVTADPKIAPGDIVLAGEHAELVHVWADRLRELREAILTALEVHP
jgi:flagellar biosynthesis/type III secretory pathway protein FliH